MITEYTSNKEKRESFLLQEIISLVAQKSGCNPKRSGRGYVTRCTSHDDRNASLSISAGDDGRILMYCHARCPIYEICASLGIRVRDLFNQHSKGYRHGK